MLRKYHRLHPETIIQANYNEKHIDLIKLLVKEIVTT